MFASQPCPTAPSATSESASAPSVWLTIGLCAAIAAVFGALNGVLVSAWPRWIHDVTNDTYGWEAFGRSLIAVAVGVPLAIAVSLIGGRLARVPLWGAFGLGAPVIALILGSAVDGTAGPVVTQPPVAVSVAWALGFALTAIAFHLGRLLGIWMDEG